MFYREIIQTETKRGISCRDITGIAVKIVKSSGISEGLCNVFVTGTTAGLLINENDRFLAEDTKRIFKRLIDEDKPYGHPENAVSHMRASLLNADITVPVASNKIVLGRWQAILLWEFAKEKRTRQLVITVLGE